MAHDVIEREVLIEASRERVWAVLTEPHHVAGWFGYNAEQDQIARASGRVRL